MSHHPTAILSPTAEIGERVRIGPHAIVEDGVTVGDGCEIEAMAQLRKGTVLGADNLVGSGAILSGDPQSLGFDRSIPSGVVAGKGNVFREYSTVHRSVEEGGNSRIGDGNTLMTGAHLGHDTVLGNENVLANNTLVAGHVEIGDRCFFGGGTVVHQHCRIGDCVMTQGMAGIGMDVPPYVIHGIGLNNIAGINAVGLRRAGFEPGVRRAIKEAFALIYRKRLPPDEARRQLGEEEIPPAAERFLNFIENPGKRGICLKTRRNIDNQSL